MSLQASLDNLKNLFNMLESDIKLLEGGRKNAAVSARKNLQNIKVGAQSMRTDVTEYFKAMPKKTVIKKEVKIVEPVVDESVDESVDETLTESIKPDAPLKPKRVRAATPKKTNNKKAVVKK